MPELPYYGYNDVTITFSSPVLIQDFIPHVHPIFTDTSTELEVELRSVGSGKIDVYYDNEHVGTFQGQGDDLTYVYGNVGGAHVYLEAIEWVD